MLATTKLALSHATLVSSEPAANSVVSASPDQVRLVFSEQVEPTLARLSLVAADGAPVPLLVAGDPHDVNAVIAPVRGLHTGSYRLVWRVVSADGHPVDGSFVFSIGAASATAPPDTGVVAAPTTWGPTLLGAPVPAAALRGPAVGTLAAFAGLLLFLSWSRGAPEQRRSTRLANALSIAAPVLLLLHSLVWLVNVTPEHRLSGDAISATIASGVGKTELWRLGLTVAASVFWWLSRRAELAFLLAAGALAVSGATGHSAAIGATWTAPAKAIHLAAAAAWLGGLLWLLTIDRMDGGRFMREASRVSRVALVSVIAVTLSGVLQALLFAPSIGGLMDSRYGAVLAAKVVGLLVLVAFGARHRFGMMPAVRRNALLANRFASSVSRQLFVMTLVFLVGGLLAYVPVPASPTVAATTHSQHE